MQLIAVVATGRNGSTLICRLLDGIPGAYVHPVDVNFLQAMNDVAFRYWVRPRVHNNTLSHRLDHLDRAISAADLIQYYGQQIEEVEDKYLTNVKDAVELGDHPLGTLNARQKYMPGEFVVTFLDALGRWCASGEAPKHAIFKTCETPYVADYERIFPDLKFVHIVRDPVKTWASVKRSLVVSGKRPSAYLGWDNMVSFLEHRWLPHARAICTRRDDRRHLLVRYEDLVTDADHVIAGLCSWAEMPLPAEPTTQTILGGRHFSEMQMNPSQKGLAAPRRVEKDMAQRYSYEEVVTERERAFIQLRTWTFARQLGYFTDAERPNPADVRRAWMPLDDWDKVNYSGISGNVRMLANILYKRAHIVRHCTAA